MLPFYAIYITSGSSSSDCFCQTEAFLLIGSNLGDLLAYLCVYRGKFWSIIYVVFHIFFFWAEPRAFKVKWVANF